MAYQEVLNRAISTVGAEVQEWIRARHFEIYSQLPKIPQSPIEEVMLVGMVGINTFAHFFEFYGVPEIQFAPSPRFGGATVRLQQRIGPYCADFLIEAHLRNEVAGHVVVECDGKDFHDAEKDAVRDRYMEERGYVVLRFTGAEIIKNPVRPVLEIIAACENLFREAVRKNVDKPVDDSEAEIRPQPSTGDPETAHAQNAARYEKGMRELYPE